MKVIDIPFPMGKIPSRWYLMVILDGIHIILYTFMDANGISPGYITRCPLMASTLW